MNILLRIHIDGVSRGNPGASGIGVTIHRENKLILTYGEYVGILNNIQSEYIALKRALELALKFDDHIIVFSDCLQVVKQRRSKNKLRRKELKTLVRQIINLENKFDIISYMFVPRKRNIHVDKVANQAVNDYFNTHYTI
ncbi:MAG: ribonuclease HI family protein [Nitrososphaeraceae archaeon]